ncbi:MAG: hypothetical protein JSR90_07075 [Proteobacteria bacterium]|nr:hypothetical protein [Pseudomonadota bacterium]
MTSIEKMATAVFIGACTSLLAALCVRIAYTFIGLGIFHPVEDYILPASAFVTGIAAVLGFAAACRFLKTGPKAASAALMLLVSAAVLVVVCDQSPAAALHRDGTFDGQVATLLSLPQLAFNAACEAAIHGMPVGDLDTLDTLGCALAALNLAGVATALLALFLLQKWPRPATDSSASSANSNARHVGRIKSMIGPVGVSVSVLAHRWHLVPVSWRFHR